MQQDAKCNIFYKDWSVLSESTVNEYCCVCLLFRGKGIDSANQSETECDEQKKARTMAHEE